MKLFVTGGAGFIGSNFIRYWLEKYPQDSIVNFDKVTYAGHLSSTWDFSKNKNYTFIKGNICNDKLVNRVMKGIDIVVHFAAESHVDRSIVDPMAFVKTNVLGTGVLLNAALASKVGRFHHISTDEVFGELGIRDLPFSEKTPYAPRTPYSASKAASDHLARAYFETYGMPVTVTNCANNFGPYQDPEKLIPRFITNLILGEKVPLMGKGENIRTWLFVLDHASAIDLVIKNGKVGETYCVGGEERTNLEVTKLILKRLGKDESNIEYVPHRLGHDFRYAIDWRKIKSLGWKPQHTFEDWLNNTVDWYLENEWWWKSLRRGRPNVDRESQRIYAN